MKSYIFLILAISGILATSAVSQNTNIEIFAEGKGTEARIMWLAPSWPDTVKAVVVKRRLKGTSEWKTLTSKPIYPLVSPTKDLSNVSTDPSVITNLREKIAQNVDKYSKRDSTSFIDFIRQDKGLALLSLGFNRDFDQALIAGFAFYDKKITNAIAGQVYEYGLFLVTKNSDKPSSPKHIFAWKYGESNSYNLTIEHSMKVRKNNNTLEIDWAIDKKSFKEYKILQGFKIDRIDGAKRTHKQKDAIWLNMNEAKPPIYLTDTIDFQKKYTYELIPVSVLGYEGKAFSFTFEPSSAPAEFVPVLKSNFKESSFDIPLEWSIPTDQEKFIDSYEIEQRVSFIEAITVSKPLPPTSKKFILKYDSAREYPFSYNFRVKCNLKNGYDPIYSEYAEVFYNPIVVPEAPKELKGEFIEKDGKHYIHLSWPVVANAVEYRIFTPSISDPKEMAWEATLPEIKNNEFDFYVKSNNAKEYTFAVAAVDKSGYRMGNLSKSIKVMSASKKLYPVFIENYILGANKTATILWNYNEPADIKGYRIYENGKLVADESIIKKGTKKYTTTSLKSGIYKYEVEAWSNTNLVSTRTSVNVIIE